MTKNFSTIYFPVTCDILTPGHIKCIRWLEKRCDELIIGLLTDEALKGYKKNAVPYKDRHFILDNLWAKNLKIVPQKSLSPERNIYRYECDAIASGDGWEKEELEVIKKFQIGRIDIPFPKKYSSKKIKQKVVQLTKGDVL